MANRLYEQMNQFDPNGFMRSLSELKSKGGDPNQMIQSLLDSGKVSQAQVNQAMQQAQRLMQMLTPGGRR